MFRLPFRPALTVALALTLLTAAPAFAGGPQARAPKGAAPPPAWEQLSPQQREQLIAPVRDRWNAEPDERQRMLDHARRWQQMSPDERKRARHGMRRWEGMNPEQREEARALFGRMRNLSDAEREALRERWRAMTPEQRREWMQRNAPKAGDLSRRDSRDEARPER
ncbi:MULTISPECIES: DUF3106 domain-containing protein [unclassified Lysobacter]|uniref:DUF3106 domain-containing protein n=1 Tax=unclassified Lysobacter TaxID=2635362 RepID=UPI0007003A3A|nr:MULTISPECIES: DUF3106 domain-containing protein [unclassified Lysobacter]KQZ66662.1 hypothetical protein ASD53_16370 [Lysobacter sp. Root559]KRC32814.1 hypothetical protein ASE10_14735 [Lysobacter sp. Root76]KRD67843.1 hypothetical protein ASE45_14025 [Lysobacter sp. Root96]